MESRREVEEVRSAEIAGADTPRDRSYGCACGEGFFASSAQSITVDNLGVPGWDPLYGYGRVDADSASGALVPPPVVPKKGI